MPGLVKLSKQGLAELVENIKTREQIAADIVKFAQDNELQIHPGQQPLKWADLVIKNGGCPCCAGTESMPL